jgi:ABC-2 type transport system permease protein
MHNFFLKTLYQKRFMALWWFVGITAITMLTLSLYHSFAASDVTQVIKGLPPALQKVAGDQSSFKTIDGYIRQQIFALRLPLLTIILSITLLVGLTAGDESRGLLETQLSLPVSRTGLLLQKLAAAILLIAVAACGSILGIALALLLIGEKANYGNVLHYVLNCVAVALVYGLVGFTIACVTGRRSLALGIASGFAFLSYLLDSMAPSVASLKTIDDLTFFHLYQNDPFSWARFLGLTSAALVLVLISLIAFNKRDIHPN